MSDASLRRFALVNGPIVLPRQVVTGQAVVVDGPLIEGVAEVSALGDDLLRIDVGGRLISPGLIDIHIHGALGHTFNEPSIDAYATITREAARRGVTSLLATLATAPIDDLISCLEFSRRWMGSSGQGARVLGVHLEGPYFSLAQAGAQNPAYLRRPDDGTPDLLLAHHDVVRMMSYAPELPGALELTADLARLGIVPAAGHSSASEAQVRAAMDAGLRHMIHIWSGQSTTVREGPWRVPGLLEASLVFEGLTVEMIADNRHLPPTLMKLAAKCIGPDRLCIISDATSGAGLPEGSRYAMAGMTYEVHHGVGMMLDYSCFGGSTTLLNQMVPVLIEAVGLPLEQAIRMASLIPAQVIGVDQHHGSLEAGKVADIALFDPDFSAWRTMIEGRWVEVEQGQEREWE